MSTSTPLLLLVDDSETARYAKSRILRQAGFNVIEAANGTDALRLAETHAPRLVLLDVRLPDLDGFEVCRRLKAKAETASTLVLQTSATYVQPSDTARALEGGADACLTEPVEPAVLIATVRALLRMKQAEEERDRLMAELEAERALLESVLRQMPAGVLIVEAPSGRVMLTNEPAARLVGGVERVDGDLAFDAAGRPVAADRWPLARSLARAEVVTGEEIEIRTRDGARRITQTSASPVRDRSGQIVAAVAIMQDVTERKREERERADLLVRERAARREAEAANRAKDEFLATLSHELRSPLNAILTWAIVLQKGQLDAAGTARALEAIERNTRLQTQLIGDLLDVSRIIAGKLTLDVGLVPLGPVIEAAVETVRTAADAKGIRIEAIVEPGVGPVSGDPSRLQQIVWNLLSNAVKFTPLGGTVTVGLRRTASHIHLDVRDSGIGIEPAFLPHVFERFRQADPSTTKSEGGLGLGLAIVRHLVELHGGTVQAASDGPGCGATFTVTFKMAAVYEQSVGWGRPPREAAPGRHPLQGIRVLAVDDLPDSRDSLAMVLEQAGAEVTSVGSAADALASLERGRPDVLLSDIAMPVRDGFGLIENVRALEPMRGGRIPAIALTAHASSEDRRRALSAGYQTYLVKPVEPDELVAAVLNLVEVAKPRAEG